ncbi:hypothetical protein BOTBODRAFT_131906 [Botryobasidium botryosum FD-172 SS1]|uniref:Amine oxidase n=1 Tax=Botryobasidium botryosum (strain FD-172 SS1) TaxID=930990 RepID=A0A067MTN0_BOTB1|nr:hypothetical protein BOTBODRAFT_131906 [Botryobasidium botryosum FD-172 SS1]
MAQAAQTNGLKRHPLDALSAPEISAISYALREYMNANTDIRKPKFVSCDLLPPAKRDVLAYLGIPVAPGQKLPSPNYELLRRAEVDFVDLGTGINYHSILSYSDKWTVTILERIIEGTQLNITSEDLIQIEEALRQDERVIKLAADIGLTPDQVFADSWPLGFDPRFPGSRRVQPCLLYARFTKDGNHYGHPLDFIPVIDTYTRKVIHIDFAPHRDANGVLSAPTTAPPALDVDGFSAAGRERVPPITTPSHYLPELLEKQKDFSGLRADLKPLSVVQPEGVSFKVTGNVIEWQKWSMHVAFAPKEGIILSTVTYNDDGELRPVFYRMSLAEMVVPYAAPEHPHNRKMAFDVGEYGMGQQANELSLGCDCLGSIHYLPGSFIRSNGEATTIKNAICIHEEDAGLLWKHTDFRTGGRAHSVRSRRLVVSMIATVANYEYAFYYYFYMDGTIELEILLTGIVSVYLLAEDEPSAPFGTTVAPRINAHHHQHIFSVRVDPMVDGLRNSVVESDIKALAHPTGSAENFAGNGFYAQETVITGSEGNEGAREWDAGADRRWTVVNPARRHYSSGKPVGYGVNLRGAAQTLVTKEDSWVARRAPFATKSLWVVRDREGERMYPAGRYVSQTPKAPIDSVSEWVKDGSNLENEDILLFLTFGITHIVRPEDWPVMPSERVKISFKPIGFFKANPSLDVPGTKNEKSVLAFPQEGNSQEGNCCQ